MNSRDRRKILHRWH